MVHTQKSTTEYVYRAYEDSYTENVFLAFIYQPTHQAPMSMSYNFQFHFIKTAQKTDCQCWEASQQQKRYIMPTYRTESYWVKSIKPWASMQGSQIMFPMHYIIQFGWSLLNLPPSIFLSAWCTYFHELMLLQQLMKINAPNWQRSVPFIFQEKLFCITVMLQPYYQGQHTKTITK